MNCVGCPYIAVCLRSARFRQYRQIAFCHLIRPEVKVKCATCHDAKRIMYPGLNYLTCEMWECEHEKDGTHCWTRCRTVVCPDCAIIKDASTL